MSAEVSTEFLVAQPLTNPLSTPLAEVLAAPLDSPAPAPLSRQQVWSRTRWGLATAYAAVLGVFMVTVGVPTERLALFAWLLAGLSIGCVGRGWRSIAGMIRDWLPFLGILVLYDLTRGLADSLGMPIHISDLAALESGLFGETLPTVWLQSHLYQPAEWGVGGGMAWWHVVVTTVYVSHFLVTPIIAAVLWLRDRRRWLSFTANVVGVAVLGVAIYILVPAAPPWYAAAEGVIPPVERLSGLGWDVVGLQGAGALFDQGQAKVNLVAAIPSLHTAYAVLVLLFFWPVLNRLGRVLLTCYPLMMGLILVYSGEHYVVDVVLGWACAAVVASSVALISRLWPRRHEPEGPTSAASRAAAVGVASSQSARPGG